MPPIVPSLVQLYSNDSLQTVDNINKVTVTVWMSAVLGETVQVSTDNASSPVLQKFQAAIGIIRNIDPMVAQLILTTESTKFKRILDADVNTWKVSLDLDIQFHLEGGTMFLSFLKKASDEEDIVSVAENYCDILLPARQKQVTVAVARLKRSIEKRKKFQAEAEQVKQLASKTKQTLQQTNANLAVSHLMATFVEGVKSCTNLPTMEKADVPLLNLPQSNLHSQWEYASKGARVADHLIRLASSTDPDTQKKPSLTAHQAVAMDHLKTVRTENAKIFQTVVDQVAPHLRDKCSYMKYSGNIIHSSQCTRDNQNLSSDLRNFFELGMAPLWPAIRHASIALFKFPLYSEKGLDVLLTKTPKNLLKSSD